MKKILFLFSLFLLLSCSNSDSDNGTNSDFHPPVWIQGNWEQEGTNGTTGVLFNFLANDFCFTSMGIVKQCQQELVNLSRQPGNKVKVTETITETTYKAEIEYIGGQSVMYSFRKLSANKIEWTAVPGSVFLKK